jgi:hypothetical protein
LPIQNMFSPVISGYTNQNVGSNHFYFVWGIKVTKIGRPHILHTFSNLNIQRYCLLIASTLFCKDLDTDTMDTNQPNACKLTTRGSCCCTGVSWSATKQEENRPQVHWKDVLTWWSSCLYWKRLSWWWYGSNYSIAWCWVLVDVQAIQGPLSAADGGCYGLQHQDSMSGMALTNPALLPTCCFPWRPWHMEFLPTYSLISFKCLHSMQGTVARNLTKQSIESTWSFW